MLSALDMFSIGIGPSSSHTVGPMRAAGAFVDELRVSGELALAHRVSVELFGSLGATGRGHGSDKAVVLGLSGAKPETVDTSLADDLFLACLRHGRLLLGGEREIGITAADIVLHRRATLPGHPNAMLFRAYDDTGAEVRASTYFSVGGGFVVGPGGPEPEGVRERRSVPYPFASADQLLEHCEREQLSIAGVMLANECSRRTEAEVRARLLVVWGVMQECVRNGCASEKKLLPGRLKVPRRAPALHATLTSASGDADPLRAMDWVALFALAVNEENAAGGRVVTAPTNGAAGIIPAVLHYHQRFFAEANADSVVEFLLTAAAIGILFKMNASISGAEVGCQGEVGSACSMAAAGLCAVLGGSARQVENAAEIGIEHNLGLTCDPIGGLVQIPCIERNAIASGKAINAARLALHGDGSHRVSLDQAIATMRATGADMKSKYKETSRGGLAVNVIEC